MKYGLFQTTLGDILVCGGAHGITHLYIDNGTKAIGEAHFGRRDDAFFSAAQEQILAYLAGELKTFSLLLAPEGTPFQQNAWRVLQQIPYGETRSYGEIATLLGNAKASRAVGLANNRNPIPIIIPCHRVIGANGHLTGYAYGINTKKRLLDLEFQTSAN